MFTINKGISMQKFMQLKEAIEKAEFLEKFCAGVRIIRLQDSAVLYSSALLAEEADFSRHTSGEKHAFGGSRPGQSDSSLLFGKTQETYEITRVPILIGGQRCAIETIQPRQIAISTELETPSDPFEGERYLAGAIGSMNLKDTLTGAYNRRYIDEALPGAMRAAYERARPLSLIFLDIDRFGLINERYCRVAGDLVLQHIAQFLRKRIDLPGSWVARYESDLFVICLPGVKNSSAMREANNLRVAIMGERLPLEGGEVSLTCSFGVQTLEKTGVQLSALMLLHQAQEKLFLAKRMGRNAIV